MALAFTGVAALVMMASLGFAQNPKSGLQPGEVCTAFQLVEVSGAMAGKQYCRV